MNLNDLRALPKAGALPAPMKYRRNLGGYLIDPSTNSAMEVIMRGFGLYNGTAVRAGVVDLFADEVGATSAVLVNDSNMNCNSSNIRYSLKTGELLEAPGTSETLLTDHRNHKAGFVVDPESRNKLRNLAPSSNTRSDNSITPPPSADLVKKPEETMDAYKRRLSHNGLKPDPKVLEADAAAQQAAWKAEKLANANITLAGEPIDKPAQARPARPTDAELKAQHIANAFSAGQESKALPSTAYDSSKD